MGEAWWSLANLKTVRFTEADIAAMRAALEQPAISDEDRFHLEFALGKAMHDAGDAAEAFAHYAAGNALRRNSQPIDAGGHQLAASIAASRHSLPRRSQARPGGAEARDPIFIVGMPRAGSTLVEQILASHRWSKAPASFPTSRRWRESGRLSRKSVSIWPATSAARSARNISSAPSVQRRTERPIFIDKLPNNWLFVPFIHLVLPNATIIDARRHPLGCCFSNFRQHYARGQAFSYDLTDIGPSITATMSG